MEQAWRHNGPKCALRLSHSPSMMSFSKIYFSSLLQEYKTSWLMCVARGVAGFWPHAYFEHILNPECEGQAQSTTNSNNHRSLSTREPVAVEMSTTSQEGLDSLEEGRRARWQIGMLPALWTALASFSLQSRFLPSFLPSFLSFFLFARLIDRCSRCYFVSSCKGR